MGISREWGKVPLSLTELCIDTTLRCGQSFRWRKIEDKWRCSLRGRVVVLRQDPTHLHYMSIFPDVSPAVKDVDFKDDTDTMLYHYFDLKHDLGALYEQWSKADPVFKRLAPEFGGVRILNQDAWEALAHKLCKHYGTFIAKVDDEEYYDFPTPTALTNPKVESHLRELGFGYRAQYIAKTAKLVASKPPNWLNGLRNPESPAWGWKPCDSDEAATYKKAHDELVSLSGVGPKVADCVSLMGLGWSEAVPVDTHVWQIAQRDYKFGKTKTKTFTKATYDAVGDHFRQLWGKQAGWAHSVLFTADLRVFAKSKEATKKTTSKMKEEEGSEVSSTVKVETKSEAKEESDSPPATETKVKVEEEEEYDVPPQAKVEVKGEEEEVVVKGLGGISKRKRNSVPAVKTEKVREAKKEYTIQTRSQKKARGLE